ncbi:MAG: LPS-assembly protein LptD [Bernardetiaceae bacterium]|nr:LPS-assembly protein LptD [Bernardetiaceae bacterium]
MVFRIILCGLCFWIAFATHTQAQVDIDSLTHQPSDTTLLDSPQDSVEIDSVAMDLADVPMTDDFATVVEYSADDSIHFDMATEVISLYKNSKITYGIIDLKAEDITIDLNENVLNAVGRRDTNNVLQNTPIFKEGKETYEAEAIRFNFKTQKAIVKRVRTQQGEAYLLGERIKKDEKNNMFIQTGLYTTCEADHPHFGIRANKIKMIGSKQIISGPFQLIISDIPTPIGFPFGIVPVPKARASGILMPSYGETRERGFFLRNGGYYWAISDYIDLSLMGEIYSKGIYGVTVQSRYNKRYHYTGNFRFMYNNRAEGERGTLNRSSASDFKLMWSHNPQPRGSSRFSASVNAGTTTFDRNNSFNQQDFLNASLNSSITYSKTFEGTPFNMTTSLRHNQNVQTEIITVFPEANLGMNQVAPFKNIIRNTRSPLNQLRFSYSLRGKAEVNNVFRTASVSGLRVLNAAEVGDTVAFNLSNMAQMLENTNMGMQHTIPISTSATILRYITVTPQANITQTIYRESYDYRWLQGNEVEIDTIRGVSQFYSYDIGANATTRLYSFFSFGENAKVQAFRHMLTPTIGFNYRPDFADERFGFYQEVPIDNEGNTRPFSRLDGNYGRPSMGRQGAVSLSLDNNVEMKLLQADGTTKKVPILENFQVRGNYNLAADSFNLSNVDMSMRTRLFEKITINAGGTVDPYTYELLRIDSTGTGANDFRVQQRRVDEFAWQNGQGLGNLSNFRVALSTTIGPDLFKKGGGKGEDGKEEEEENGKKYKSDKGSQEDLDFINDNPDLYVDFSVPWSLNFGYNINYRKNGFAPAVVTQTVDFRGDVSITEKWKIRYQTGYDIVQKEFSFTQFEIHRDLHCWQLSVNWIPFGPRQSYTLNLGVKAAMLQDLKLARRNSWYDRR